MWERVRGHRRGGTLPQHEEKRHYAATTILIITAAVAAASAIGTTLYTMSEQAAEASRQKQASNLEAEQATQLADAERTAARDRNRRIMASQEAAAGGAGVRIGEGSLLIDAIESAQYGEYDAQLAAFPHSLQSERAQFTSKLFGQRASSIRSSMGIQAGLAGASSATSSYGAYSRGSLGSGQSYQKFSGV